MNTTDKIKPPIKSGWRGNLSGALEDSSNSSIGVAQVTLTLDPKLAWALCNVLCDSTINGLHNCTDAEQRKSLSTLGAALGRLIDHHAANNGGRELIK